VRGLAEARSQTCGRELDSYQQRHHCLRYPRTWLDPNEHRHDSGFSYVGTTGYATEVGPRGGTGFLIKQDVMGCVTQLRWKRQSLIKHMGPIEEQVEAELACACQRVCTPYFADA
jgi:hypothetical protein